MPPLRRYLRITQHSVLETHIYFEDPTLALPFLRQPAHPLLAEFMAAVRPLILPKLREERDRKGKGKGKGKRKGVKDVVEAVGGEYEITVFLKEVEIRHNVLVRRKTFRERGMRGLGDGERLMGGDRESAVVVDGDGPVIRAESDEEDDALERLPSAQTGEDGTGESESAPAPEEQDEESEKKKLGFAMDYSGYTIYGKTLCLVVKQNHPATQPSSQAVAKTRQGAERPQAQASVSGWIASTQAAADLEMDDEG